MAGKGPTFIYVGTPKAGSSWLFEAFNEHPEIFVVPTKSSGRYESTSPGAIEEYLAAFAGSNSRASGEIAHDAYVTSGAAERLRQEFPNIKILVCLREPGSFAASCFKWWLAHTERFGKTVEAMKAHPHFQALIDYQAGLDP
ncbi:MAG: hypothetical protein ACR2OY_07660, partial [Boseongicola sp.]